MRDFCSAFLVKKEKADINRHIKSKEKRKGKEVTGMRVIKMPIIKIAVIILSCVCLTSCSCNDAKKETKKYLDTLRITKKMRKG